MQTASTSMAFSSSATGGRVGEIRILASLGSLPKGNVAPAGVIATPASLQSATARLATGFAVSRLMK